MIWFRALTVLALLIVSACGSRDGSVDAVATGPDGTTYVVTGITEGGRTREPVAGSEIRLAFADGSLRITAGCNAMSGAYTRDGTRLTVEPLAMTEMGCTQPLMEQDAWVAGLFEKPVQFSTESIISGDVVLSLTDREQASPDKPLRGTKWLLDTIAEGGSDGVASSVNTVAHLEFDDTAVGVYDGCNSGGGPVTFAGDRVTFGEREQTLRGCSGGDAEATQRAFREVLEGTASVAVEEDRLTVTRGSRSLGFHAVPVFPPHD